MVLVDMMAKGGAMKTGASGEAQRRMPGKGAGAHAEHEGRHSHGTNDVAGKVASCAEGWLEGMARKARERKKTQRKALLKENSGSSQKGKAGEATLGKYFKQGLGMAEADGMNSQASQRQPQLPERRSRQEESEEEFLAQNGGSKTPSPGGAFRCGESTRCSPFVEAVIARAGSKTPSPWGGVEVQ